MEGIKKMYIGLYVRWAIFTFDFNHM